MARDRNEARSICTQLQPGRMKREREEYRKRTRTIKEHQELEIEEYLRENKKGEPAKPDRAWRNWGIISQI